MIDRMNWLYLTPSLAAVLYLALCLLKGPASAVSVLLVLLLAVHGSEALRAIYIRPAYEAWDVALNWVHAGLSILIATCFKWQRRAACADGGK